MNNDELRDFITGALVIDKPVGMTSHDVVTVSYTHLTLPTILLV